MVLNPTTKKNKTLKDEKRKNRLLAPANYFSIDNYNPLVIMIVEKAFDKEAFLADIREEMAYLGMKVSELSANTKIST